MSPILLLFFVLFPLLLLFYLIIEARRFSWMSYITIMVIMVISIAVVFPAITSVMDNSSGNSSGNLSELVKSWDGFASGFPTETMWLVLKVVVIVFAVVFVVWLCYTLMRSIIEEKDRSERRARTARTAIDIDRYIESKKKDDIDWEKYSMVTIKRKSVDGAGEQIVKKDKKELIVSGWSRGGKK